MPWIIDTTGPLKYVWEKNNLQMTSFYLFVFVQGGTIQLFWIHNSIQLKVQFNHLLWALFELGIMFNQLFRQSIRFTVQHSIQFCIHNQKCSSILNPIQYLKIPPIEFMIQHYTSSHYGIVKKRSNFFPLLLHLTLDKIIFHLSKDWTWTRGPWMVTITAVKLQIYLVS